MVPAHGEDCEDFPEPEHPAEFHPFFGKYASTGQPVIPSYGEDDGTDTTDENGGTGAEQNFDPKYYEQAPQNPPDVQVPPEAPQGGDQQGQGPGPQ
jgi:hypothetical protein